MRIDPVTLAVVGHTLAAVAEEMGTVTMRTARSNLIKEGGDFSTALYDREGRLLQHGRDMPAHQGLFPVMVKELLRTISPGDVRPGDAFITNAEDVAGSHLNDVKVIAPIFYGGELVMWAANLAHWPDVGGAVPGSYYGPATELFQEGLQVPPVRCRIAGELNREVVALILKNVRGPGERLGDLRAQLAAVDLAAERIGRLFEKYGRDTTFLAFDGLIAYAERRMREAIRGIPDGTYRFADFLDNDGVVDRPVRLAVAITVKDDTVSVDFAGSGTDVAGPVNSPYAQTCSAAYYAIRCVTDFTIPSNEGAYRPIRVLAPAGSVVNAPPHKPRVYCTHETATRLVDVCLGALAQAVPDRVPAAGYGSSFIMIVGGVDPRTGAHYAWYEPIAGGFGARPGLDGIDGTRVHMGNTANTPVEVFERDYPLVCEAYEFLPDSAGPGKFRGGLGVTKRVRPRPLEGNVPICSAVSDRNRFPPYGLAGGKPGRTGLFLLCPGTPAERPMSGPCPGKSSVRLHPGETWAAFTPGGGGWGSPLDRDPERVLEDVLDEKVSVEAAARDYGVVVDRARGVVDWAATEALRRRMRGGASE